MTILFICISFILAGFLVFTLKSLKRLSSLRDKLQKRFNNLQTLSNTGYFDRNLIDDKVWWSAELKKLVGLDPNISVNTKKDAFSYIYEEDRAAYIEDLENLISSKGTFLTTEYRGENIKTGELRYFHSTIQLLKDNNGLPIRIIGTIQDITEKKEMQIALSESEIKRANVMANIDDLVFIISNEGYFVEYYNARSNNELYSPPENFLHKHHSEVLPPKVSKQFDEVLKLIHQDKMTRQFDYSLEINGELKWNNVRVSVYKDTEGKDNGYIIVARDFTNRKNTEEKLSESLMRFRDLSELLPVAVFEMDIDSKIVYVNRKGFKWFQYDENDLRNGISSKDLVVESQREELMSNMKRRIMREDIGAVEYKAKRKNGELFDVLIYATPIISHNNVIGVRGVLMDISERKKYLKEIEKFLKFESLGILAAGIAHNFKNIIAAITLSVDIIKVNPESIDKHLKRISSSLEQANALATRFQKFTKTDEPMLEEVNINKILEDSIEITTATSKFEIVKDLDDKIDSVQADSKQLNEIFVNLLINAMQAMNGKGKIHLKTLQVEINNNEIPNLTQGTFIKIIIKDNGIGMTEEQLEQIYTPFYTTKQEGSGLGLVTVFSIVKAHNGSIQVSSELNKGTQFDIYLPVKKEELNDNEQSKNPLKTDLKLTKLILIDDDKVITDSIKKLIEFSDDFEIKAFNNPHEAIQYLKLKSHSEIFDVAIIDLNLDRFDTNGIQVLMKVKEYYPNIKSLVSSIDFTEQMLKDYNDYGFDNVLVKSCNYPTLIEKIKKAMDNKKA